MRKLLFALMVIIFMASCTKEVVSAPKKKNIDEVMRKRGRNPSLPPTPY